MAEGPEPQELMEHVEHNLDAEEEGSAAKKDEGSGHKSKHMKVAMIAACLAVFAAIASLLGEHAGNEAILLQIRASDQWSYYEAKSTKGHVYEANKDLVEALAKIIVAEGSTRPGQEQPLKELAAQINTKVEGFENDKKEIKKTAEDLEQESAYEFAKHQLYSFAVSCFQIGIVLVSVAILLECGAFLSVIAGAIGIVLLILGYLR